MGPLPLAATGSHLNCAALASLSVCVNVFASAAFSVGVRGRISSRGGVTVGEVAVGGIGECVMTVQADSAMVAERRLMARQLSPTRSASKLMRACSSGDTSRDQIAEPATIYHHRAKTVDCDRRNLSQTDMT